MRYLIILLLFLIASVWIGVEMMRHPGYLLIVYHPWTVQTPIWFALLTLIVVFVLFYFIINSIDRLQFMWFRLRNWMRFRREHRSYSQTQHGLSALIEGQWKKAENLLISGVNQTVEPLMNYLGAAKAAHELGAYDRRDQYIQKAYQIAPHDNVAIGITQAELELAQDQLEHAAATLNHLRQETPSHPRVLELLEKVYVRLADWQNLMILLPQLRRAKVFNTEQQNQFEKNVYSELLMNSQSKNLSEIQKIWNEMPRAARKDPDVVYAYVTQLLRFIGTEKEIEDLIQKTLKYNWQPQLVKIYGKIPSTNHVNRQLATADRWLETYGQRPELLLTLGRLCVRAQLWGRAKEYFERCLAIEPNAEASLEYGKLLEHLDEPEEAMQKYRMGLSKQAGE